jgi:hypothetical protein
MKRVSPAAERQRGRPLRHPEGQPERGNQRETQVREGGVEGGDVRGSVCDGSQAYWCNEGVGAWWLWPSTGPGWLMVVRMSPKIPQHRPCGVVGGLW